MNVSTERELDQVFAAARNAYPDLDPSSEFLAGVWVKIEERRTPSWLSLISDWSPKLAFAGGLAAVILTLTAAVNHQQSRNMKLLESSYVDALTIDSLDEQDGAQWILAGLPR